MINRRDVVRLFITGLFALTVCVGLEWSPVAAETLSHAGVVVRHDDGHLSFSYVTFSEAEMTGIDLLKRSGFAVVTVSFGGLGEGVCSIDEHGCPSTDCRKRVCQGPRADDPFWQYFRQTGDGEWKSLALGASATKVRDGDIDGWSWTGTVPNLPALTLDEVALRAGYTGETITHPASPVPGAVFRREGVRAESTNQDRRTLLAGGGLLMIAAAFVFFAVIRSRRGVNGS